MRVGYLGPPGTYSHQAALAGLSPTGELVALTTIHDVVMAVEDGRVHRGVVPIENSLEGSVNATLDAIAFHAPRVRIVGESVFRIHHCLVAGGALALEEIELVVSHPQALGQSAQFLRTRVGGARLRTGTSTAEAVREVVDHGGRWAALGPRAAAERYGATVLAADVEDEAGNATRFAWLAREADGAGAPPPARPHKTAIAFWPRESDHAGWLVDCLAEFSGRGVNLTRIESRPRKVGLGEYVFFVDLGGHEHDPAVAGGLEGVRSRVAQLRVLGSFPVA